MNSRHRLHETYRFGNPDKVPLDPGWPRESTLAAWRELGLPPDVPWRAYLWDLLGLPPEPQSPIADLGVSFKMLPHFEEIVLERANGHLVVQDYSGAVVEISDRYDFSYLRSARDFVTRKWHRFPLQQRRDWEEKLKWRYNPLQPERTPADFAERCRMLRGRETPFTLTLPGPFWQLRDWIGFENLCVWLIEQPDFIAELIEFWTGFVLQALEPILANVELDLVMINEDMAYKAHSMISPAMVRRFLMPCWQAWGAAFKVGGINDEGAFNPPRGRRTRFGIPEGESGGEHTLRSSDQKRTANPPVYAIDSDGYIAELIPLWIEAGFESTWPVEVAAGNDILALRRRFGRQFAYGGGIDKRALAAGGAAMAAELERVAPLIREGGYLPTCDHGVPPDVSWPNFIAYTRRLAQLTGWL